MTIQETILATLSKHNKISKTDTRIKTTAMRIIQEFVHYKVITIDNKGKILNQEYNKLHELSNYKLLEMIENTLIACHEDIFQDSLIITIQSLDYLGKCWYTPFEMKTVLESITKAKHNKNKIKNMLDTLCKEGKCLRISNPRFEKYYRILYTSYS